MLGLFPHPFSKFTKLILKITGGRCPPVLATLHLSLVFKAQLRKKDLCSYCNWADKSLRRKILARVLKILQVSYYECFVTKSVQMLGNYIIGCNFSLSCINYVHPSLYHSGIPQNSFDNSKITSAVTLSIFLYTFISPKSLQFSISFASSALHLCCHKLNSNILYPALS